MKINHAKLFTKTLFPEATRLLYCEETKHKGDAYCEAKFKMKAFAVRACLWKLTDLAICESSQFSTRYISLIVHSYLQSSSCLTLHMCIKNSESLSGFHSFSVFSSLKMEQNKIK